MGKGVAASKNCALPASFIIQGRETCQCWRTAKTVTRNCFQQLPNRPVTLGEGEAPFLTRVLELPAPARQQRRTVVDASLLLVRSPSLQLRDGLLGARLWAQTELCARRRGLWCVARKLVVATAGAIPVLLLFVVIPTGGACYSETSGACHPHPAILVEGRARGGLQTGRCCRRGRPTTPSLRADRAAAALCLHLSSGRRAATPVRPPRRRLRLWA